MTLSDNHYEAALAAAIDIGKDEGMSAASWVFDGNTTDDTYRRVLAGIEEGDPEVLDTLPSADLSGQWADGRTPHTLLEDIASTISDDDTHITAEMLLGDVTTSALCDAYEDAFNDAVCDAIAATARKMLA